MWLILRAAVQHGCNLAAARSGSHSWFPCQMRARFHSSGGFFERQRDVVVSGGMLALFQGIGARFGRDSKHPCTVSNPAAAGVQGSLGGLRPLQGCRMQGWPAAAGLQGCRAAGVPLRGPAGPCIRGVSCRAAHLWSTARFSAKNFELMLC